MKLLFIVNPISGGINKKPFLNRAESFCEKYGIDISVFKTTGTHDIENLKLQLNKFKPDRVVSVGGDGTFLFSANALLKTNIPIGIIPLGSANGMATELGVSLKPMQALQDAIISNIIGDLDMLVINNTYKALHIGDVGINAQIVKSYENDEKRGMATYAKYFIEELKNSKPFAIKVEANNSTFNERGVMIGICNARKYGTGIPINMDGNPMDGDFELVIIKQINTNTILKAGLSKFDESFLDHNNTSVIKTNKAHITFEKERLLQLDGEVIGEFKELKVDILKGAVKLLTTKDNVYL